LVSITFAGLQQCFLGLKGRLLEHSLFYSLGSTFLQQDDFVSYTDFMKTLVRFTYEDLEQFPDDGKRREIIGGELYTMPSPSIRHQRIVGFIFSRLYNFLEEHPLGEVFVSPIDVIFHIDDVIIPDVAFISNERQELISKRGIEGAPDLVTEVISPSSVKRDLEVKRKLCQREGVLVYIAVDPEREQVYGWDAEKSFVLGKDDVLTCSVLPGFELAVERLFKQ
jgi:Uma2 family endonuclease